MNEMKHILNISFDEMMAKYTTVKSFTFTKVSLKLYNFRVPVYKRVPLPLMKWYPPFTMTAGQVYECEKVSLSEKLVLNYAT